MCGVTAGKSPNPREEARESGSGRSGGSGLGRPLRASGPLVVTACKRKLAPSARCRVAQRIGGQAHQQHHRVPVSAPGSLERVALYPK